MTIQRGRNQARPAAKTPPRFKVGDIVAVNDAAGDLLPKHEKRELLEARFEITRLLPDRQQSFHYRIKNAVTGQERAVTETGLREAPPCSGSMGEGLPDNADSAEPDSTSGTQSNASSDESRARDEQEDCGSGNASVSRPSNDKVNFPKPARPALARAR